MLKKLSNPITKSIIMVIIPTAYSTLFSLAITDIIDSPLKGKLIAGSIFLFLVHIVLLILYGRYEHKQKNYLNELEKLKSKKEGAYEELKTVCDLLSAYNKTILDNANHLYEHIFSKKGHCNIEDWNWMASKGDELCKAIYDFVKSHAVQGNKFAVSMIFKRVENKQNGYTMMSRTSYETSHVPKSYRSFVPEKDAKNSYYKKVIESNPSRPQILLNKKEIKKHFANSTEQDYSQFIALPISCKGKTIGIIQIVGYENSFLSKDRTDIEELCNSYLSIATNIMLLTDKSENAKQVL